MRAVSRAVRLLQHLPPHRHLLPRSLLRATIATPLTTNAPAASFATSMSSEAASQPVYEKSIKEMKAYLDDYGVSYSDCVEKSDIVQRVKDTLANPAATKVEKKAPAAEGKVGAPIVKLLGDKLVAKSGKFNTSSLQAKVVALYFSAHWCGPCRSFTPALRQLYVDTLKKQGVEIVFVSSDQDDDSFKGYFGEMPWLALPFDEREIKENLSSAYRVSGIPSLIVLNAQTGQTISTDGRRDVMMHKNNVGTHWLSLLK